MLVFEFFSGVGGMHQALTSVPDLKIKSIFPFDINPNANITYLHNFGVKPFEVLIESFSLEDYEKICANENSGANIIWTMSPPCQPFTRQGKEQDIEDNRSVGFLHLIKILEMTKFPPKYFFLENVKNFETSDACEIVKKSLLSRKYKINQFLLSPNQVGVPNSRQRYYLLARGQEEKDFVNSSTNENKFNDEIITSSEILYKLELVENKNLENLFTFLNYDHSEESFKKDFYMNEKLLKKETTNSIDIVTLESNNTCCFTKGYGKLLKGSGSILLVDTTMDKVKFKIIYF